jgi:hypothetical protein
MPRIPQFQPQVGMPTGTGQAPVNERPFVDPNAGEARMWGQVADTSTDLGRRIADYNLKEQRAQESVEALRLENQFRTDVDSYLSGFKQRNDYDNFEGEAKEFLTQTWNKYSGQASSPAVRATLEKMYLNTSFQTQVFVRARKAAAIVEIGEAEHDSLRDNAIKMWVGADPAYRPIIAKGYEMKVRELADRQVFSAGKAEQFVRTFNSTAQELDFENKLYNDPRAALNDANNSEMYQDVDAVKRSKFAHRAKQAVEAYGRDVDMQRKEQERIAKEKTKEAQKATGDLFVNRFAENALTRQEILRSNLDPTGENSKEHWLSKLDKKEEKPEGYVTDKVKETQLYSRIVRDPESVTDDEILNSIGKGLSHEDGKGLINERRTRLKEPKDPAEVAIYDNLKRDRKAGLFGGGPEGDLEYAKQVEAFKKWRTKNPKEDPSTYYEKLTEPYKRNFISNLLDGNLSDKPDPKKRREEMAGGYGYGKRADGTEKGRGFLGELKRPDGRVSTELSVGVTIDGRDMEIPSLVPTLNKKEIDYLLATPEGPAMWKTPMGKQVLNKAVAHAKDRIAQGKSPFAQQGESKTGKPLVGYKNGKPVYDLGNGKWQVGE